MKNSVTKSLGIVIIENFIWILVLVVAVVAAFTVPKFFTVRNLLNLGYQSASFSMMVLGMAFCLMVGQFDLSLESTFAFAPAIGVLFMLDWFPNVPPIIAIFITILVGAGVGMFNGVMVVKLGINAFLQTLSTLIILRGIVLYLIPQGLYEIPASYLFLGEYVISGTTIPLVVPLSIFIFLLAHFIITRTPFGRDLLAIGSNEAAAFLAGVNISKVKLSAFVISGIFSALGGLFLVGRMASVTNMMGSGDILEVFAATVLGGVALSGGVGSMIGAFGGVIVLSEISNILSLSGVNPFLVQATQGSILLIAIISENSRETLYKKVTQL